MDREDARLVVAALDSRLNGDGEALEQLHASSFVRMAGLAARVRALAAGWPPAIVGAEVIDEIAMRGAAALERPIAARTCQIFVDKMRELVDEPARPIRNRHARRAARVVAVPELGL